MSMNGNDLERQRPYAAPSNVVSVIGRLRRRNLPERIDSDLYRLAGVPEGAMYRVTQALRFLGLMDEDGRPTDAMRALAGAPDDQYRQLFEGIVRDAYREDFDRVNPSEDSQAQIVRAFQPYQPRSQTNRMVILFLALCREAGIPVVDAPRERPQTTRRPSPGQAAPRPAQRKKKGAAAAGSGQEELDPSSTLIFGVTEEDVAVLGEEEFREVWTALGAVARARARRRGQVLRMIEGQEEVEPDDRVQTDDQPAP